MTEVATEGPAELVPILPPPDAAEVEAAPDVALETDVAETPDQAVPAADAPGDAPAERALPFEIDPAVGGLRRAILDHLLDSAEAGPQSVAQILAAMPAGTSRNTLESALRRAYTAGEIERVGPGLYVIGKPKPPEAAKQAPPETEPVRSDEVTDQDWLSALEAFFVDPSSWNVEELGPGPDNVDNQIPAPIRVRFVDRLRKREERRRDREAALAKQAEADAALRAKLVAGCFNNVTLGPGLSDLAPIKAMLAEGVPLDHVLIGLKRRCDRRIDPRAAPIASWREERFLTEVARSALLGGLLPRLVDAWSKAGTAPAKAVERAEAQPAVSAPPDHETPPAPSPANGSATPGGDEIGSMAAALLRDFGSAEIAVATPPDDAKPVVAGREAVRAAFARNRVPPQPPAPQPQAKPQPVRQAEHQPEEISREGWEELVAGFVAGTVDWGRRLGPPPGEKGCLAPKDILRRSGLA
jgi:hypothetical protein